MSRNNNSSIQEQNVVLGAIVLLGSLLFSLFSAVIISHDLKKRSRNDTKLSKEINTILKSGSKWIVTVVDLKIPNAFVLSFGRRLFVTNTLLQLLNEREVIAVLLHEAYHAANKHGLKFIVFYSTFLSIVASCISTMTPAAFLLFLATACLAPSLWNILISKRLELRADSFAVKHGYGKELSSALEKLQIWINKRRPPLECTTIVCKIIKKIDQLLSSHPEIETRLKNILKQISKMKSISLQNIKRIILKKSQS